jgi:hypothetical protein
VLKHFIKNDKRYIKFLLVKDSQSSAQEILELISFYTSGVFTQPRGVEERAFESDVKIDPCKPLLSDLVDHIMAEFSILFCDKTVTEETKPFVGPDTS